MNATNADDEHDDDHIEMMLTMKRIARTILPSA